MRYGIYLTFDNHTESTIRALQKKFVAEIPGIHDITKSMPPHLTMLIFDDTDSVKVTEEFANINICIFSLVLNNINHFSSRQNVLYIQPLISKALKDAYLHIRQLFEGFNITPEYQHAENWKPHVTLVKRMDNTAFLKAKSIAEQEWQPLNATITAVGLINVQKPLEVLTSKFL